MFIDDAFNYEVEIFETKIKMDFCTLERAKTYCKEMLANGHTALLYTYCDFTGELVERIIYQHKKHSKRFFRKTSF